MKIAAQYARQIRNTNKAFIVYNTKIGPDGMPALYDMTLTNDLHRHYVSGLNRFKVVDDIREDLQEPEHYSIST
tara:strand:+ start:666 stop:887 length:222 start_codon:yes stop_codon:yes gene_type:complete